LLRVAAGSSGAFGFGYATGAVWTLDVNGRLELLRPMGMQPASNIIKDRQTSFFNGVPVRTS
jgi:hypothetical protein